MPSFSLCRCFFIRSLTAIDIYALCNTAALSYPTLYLYVTRIVVCGTQSRAKTIASHFDVEPKPVSITSSRGFTTITGCYNGVPVSAVSIGMVSCVLSEERYIGVAMTDGDLFDFVYNV
jgi:hypothetical protein